MPLWVPFATAAIAAAITICIFILTGHRERTKSKCEAIAKFRAAFAEAITQINNKDAHFLMRQAQVQHDIAIYEFRPFVNSKQIKNFDEAVQKFQRYRNKLRGSVNFVV